MALRSGLGAQVMVGPESTYGTYIAPTRAYEFRSEGLTYNRGTIESQAIRKGTTMARTGRWARNDKGGGGPISFEVATNGFGLILKHALGTVVTTTPGGATLARLHTVTFGDLDDISLTIQAGIPEQDTGTVKPFNFLGGVCTDWTLAVGVDELLTFDTTWDFQSFQTSSAIATPSFVAGSVYGFQDAAITLSGSAQLPRSISLNCTNGVATDRYVISNPALKRRPVMAAFRELNGTMSVDFDNMTNANYYANAIPGSEFAVVMTVTHSSIIEGATPYSFTATMPSVEVTEGGTPTVSGPDLVTLDLGFRVRDNGAAAPLTIAYISTDTAA